MRGYLVRRESVRVRGEMTEDDVQSSGVLGRSEGDFIPRAGQSSGHLSPLTSHRILATCPHQTPTRGTMSSVQPSVFSLNLNHILKSECRIYHCHIHPLAISSPYPSSASLGSLLMSLFLLYESILLTRGTLSRQSQLTVQFQFNCYDNVLQVLKAFY